MLFRSPTLPRGSGQTRVHPVDVVVIVERIEEIDGLLVGRAGQADRVLRDPPQFRRHEFPAGLGEPLADGAEIFRIGQEPGTQAAFGNFLSFERLDILGAGSGTY